MPLSLFVQKKQHKRLLNWVSQMSFYTTNLITRKKTGFCFLEYEDHKTAAQARRRLMSGKVKVWGNVGTVEWADPIKDPDPEVMAKVKVLFVSNLANTVTEERDGAVKSPDKKRKESKAQRQAAKNQMYFQRPG
ncbi:heterogeneous nuclear ribonucleoprotein Q-like isoform X4 [Rattus norvegicus]|uniref:heterogeneous nuclear ribonucleoprotein Q-like isoform X4 n=1 Tax=Rattus norvegicus TaxID=10116 RepID=UPI002FD83027